MRETILILLVIIWCIQIAGADVMPNPSFTISRTGNDTIPPNMITNPQPNEISSYAYTPFEVQFRDTSSGSYRCIGWNFGDNNILFGKMSDPNIANPVHTYYYRDMGYDNRGYRYPMQYWVTLYVGLSEGSSGTPCSYMEAISYGMQQTSQSAVFKSTTSGVIEVYPTPTITPTPIITKNPVTPTKISTIPPHTISTVVTWDSDTPPITTPTVIETAFKPTLSVAPTKSARDWDKVGLERYNASDYSGALEAFNSALVNDPNDKAAQLGKQLANDRITGVTPTKAALPLGVFELIAVSIVIITFTKSPQPNNDEEECEKG